MKKAFAVAALSVLALTACGTEAQTQPVALESVPAFSTLIHISLHPAEAPVTAQPAAEAQEPAPVIADPVAVAQPAPVAVYVPAPVTNYQVVVPAPVQTPAPVVIAPAVVALTPTPTPTAAATPSPAPVLTEPPCVSTDPLSACWHHLEVIPTPTPTPTPEPKDDQK